MVWASNSKNDVYITRFCPTVRNGAFRVVEDFWIEASEAVVNDKTIKRIKVVK